MFANNKDAELICSFEGTGISIMGNWVKDGGIAEVYLDGKLDRTIDTYYNYSNQQHQNVSIWHVFQLKPGQHKIRIRLTGEKNINATSSNLYITEAIIYKTSSKKSDAYKFSFEK